MTDVRRVVLDVLMPHDPSILTFSERIADVESVEAVTVSLIELDNEVRNVHVAVEGTELSYDAIENAIDSLGGAVHSVDQVSCGAYTVREGQTNQGE